MSAPAATDELARDDPSLAESVRVLSDRISDAAALVRRLAPAAGVDADPALDVPIADLKRRLRDALDDLDECQAECERLSSENDALRLGRVPLQTRLNEIENELRATQKAIRVMEATRGWRLLVWYRRLRDRLLGRM